jgi:type IV secretory pathway TrbF-like protein
MAESERKRNAMYMDLVTFAIENIGRATHDSLLRFKWAEFGYSHGCAAITYVLCRVLATVNRDTRLTPEELAEMVKERVIEFRNEADEDEDDD